MAFKKGNLFIDGESVIEDEASGHVILNTNVSVTSSRFKYGNESLSFTGNTSYLTVNNHSDFNLGSGDFTLDFWMYPTEQSDNNEVCSICDVTSNNFANGGITLSWSSGSSAQFNIYGPSGSIGTLPFNPITNDWQHVALVRSGDTFIAYFNGISIGEINASSGLVIPFTAATTLNIGRYRGSFFANSFPGYIDQFRMVKGEALWTENFILTDENLYYNADIVNPNIEITYPTTSPIYYTQNSSVTLHGTATGDDSGIDTINWINDRGGADSVSTINLPNWTSTVTALQEGANLITITAVDESTNSGTDTVTLYRDTTDPSITIDNPTDNDKYRTAAASINLSGTASDAVAIKEVTWDNFQGFNGTAMGTESWSISNIPLTEGVNTIQVMVEDIAGNTSYDQVEITKIGNSDHLSYYYNVINNKRGQAKLGWVRPTIKQYFTTVPDFDQVEPVQEPEEVFYSDDLCTLGAGAVYATGTNGSRTPDKLFDDNYTGNYLNSAWLTSNGSLPVILRYDFGAGNEKQIEKYTIQMIDRNNQPPKTWTFEGSNDALSWTVLDTVADGGFEGEPAYTKKEFTFENLNTYRFYRFEFTAGGDPSGSLYNRIEIGEIEMMEVVP